MGNRIAKHVYLDNTFAELSLEKSTYYVRDASGNTMAVYEKTYDLVEEQTSYLLTERHICGSSRLGMDTEHIEMIGEQPDTLHRRLGQKQYELSNHLGNVLSVISDIKLPVVDEGVIVSYTAVVVSATDYSAFGVALYGRTWSSDSYRYGFNGKEKDDELNQNGTSYTFEYRVHDSRLGRFLSIDPVAKSYPWNSTYCFAENRVIDGIDLEGLEWVSFGDVWHDLTGKTDIEKQTFLDTYKNAHYGNLSVVEINAYWKPGEYWKVNNFSAEGTEGSLPAGTQFVKYNSLEDAKKGKSSYISEAQATGVQVLGQAYNALFSTAGADGANTGGELGGKDGWDNGGKQLFFGTIGTILSGGTLAAGGLSATVFAAECGNLALSADDISAGILADGSTVLSKVLGKEAIENIKMAADVKSFVKGLHDVLSNAVGAGKGMLDDATWNALNLMNDEVSVINDSMDKADSNAKK
jgi:RHS repeat-associated protein